MKQSKLRRRRVIRFAIMYYAMLVLFLALIVGPAVAGPKFVSGDTISNVIDGILPDLRLVQPNGQDHDNTNSTMLTGTGRVDPPYSGVLAQSSSTDGSRPTDRIRLF
jgi:1,3-beta-glucan synthase